MTTFWRMICKEAKEMQKDRSSLVPLQSHSDPLTKWRALVTTDAPSPETVVCLSLPKCVGQTSTQSGHMPSWVSSAG